MFDNAYTDTRRIGCAAALMLSPNIEISTSRRTTDRVDMPIVNGDARPQAGHRKSS